MLLIIDNQLKYGISLAASFSYMGILAYSVKPSEALSELCPLYRAIIIKEPEGLADICDYVSRLRAYRSDIPVFALCDSLHCDAHINLFNGIFPTSATAKEIAIGIILKSRELGCPQMGEYKLAGINSSCTLRETEYFYQTVRLTAKERMILRFLIRSYPHEQGTSSILKYVFHPSRRPEPSAVRTHISAINKIFERATGSKLIISFQGAGYIIATPEIIEARLLTQNE